MTGTPKRANLRLEPMLIWLSSNRSQAGRRYFRDVRGDFRELKSKLNELVAG
jgi:hypothetical protein